MSDTTNYDHEISRLRTENKLLKQQIDALSQPSIISIDDPTIYQQALSNVSDAVAMLSLDGTLLFANNQFYRDYGSNVKIGETKIYDLSIFIKTKEEFEQRLPKIRENGGQINFQADYMPPEETNRHVHDVTAFISEVKGGEVIWLFMQDITELVNNRDELRETNLLLDTIINNLPLYLFVKDVDNELRYVYWNNAFAQYSKIPASRVIGRTDFDVFPVYDDAMKFRNDDMEVIKTNQPINRHETYEAADGTIRICQTLKTLVHRQGRGPLLVGLSWDITNMKDIEQELVQERLRAENSDRLKSTFLANMSHEIRTPLNAIVGFSELLAQTDESDQRQLFADIIKQNSDSLLQLINDILDISKIEAGTLEYIRSPFELGEMFESIHETNKNRMRENVRLVYDQNDTDGKIILNEDRNRLTQVVTNLINNAIKFTTKGEIGFGYKVKGDVVEAYVRDTGMGIAPEKVDKVFDRFVKLNTYAQGTGLGLSICKLILNIIGGKIWVESEVNKGSTFYFTIPYTTANPKATANASVAEAAAETEGKHPDGKDIILVAEDVRSNYMLLQALIGKKYHLEWAHDGLEAIQKFKELHPKLILMDVKMPNMDGLEATRMIRTYSTTVPIIALSAFAFEADKQKAYDAGVDGYLTKPVTRVALDNTLNKYMK